MLPTIRALGLVLVFVFTDVLAGIPPSLAPPNWTYYDQYSIGYGIGVTRSYFAIADSEAKALKVCQNLYAQFNHLSGTSLDVDTPCYSTIDYLSDYGPAVKAAAIHCYRWDPVFACHGSYDRTYYAAVQNYVHVLICPKGNVATLLSRNDGTRRGYSLAFPCVSANARSLFQVAKHKARSKECDAVGQPIVPSMGVKIKTHELGVSIGQHRLSMHYDSSDMLPGASPVLLRVNPDFQSVSGILWNSSIHSKIIVFDDGSVAAYRGRGSRIYFSNPTPLGGDLYQFSALSDTSDALVGLGPVGSAAGYFYRDNLVKQLETYDSSGRLTSIVNASGAKLSLQYSSFTLASNQSVSGYLTSVSDNFGRSIGLAYSEANGPFSDIVLTRIVDPAGRATSLGYDWQTNLIDIAYPDSTHTKFSYLASPLSWALSGKIDENNALTETYEYDSTGVAIATSKAGGVSRFTAQYSTPPGLSVVGQAVEWVLPTGVTVAEPTGAASSIQTVRANGSIRLASRSQPAGSGCTASVSSQSYDAKGNFSSRDDFNGYRTCFANDLARNLEVVRVEGLAGGAACGVTAVGSALPAGSRKVSTQWHPDWSFTVKQAEPGRITTSVYNGQPDPFSNGALANCAPAGATLPDGKPIAVLCRRVEQATIDVDGAQGFAALPQAGVAAREQRWTYNQVGQVLTATDALGRTTTYTYFADSAFTGSDPDAVGHTLGDLRQITNPAGPNGVLLFTNTPVTTTNNFWRIRSVP